MGRHMCLARRCSARHVARAGDCGILRKPWQNSRRSGKPCVDTAGDWEVRMAGIPGLAGTEHIGLTVPDLEAATRFFVDVIGGRVLFDAGPFMATDDWMARHLGVHSRAVIRKLRMIKIECGPSLELFQYRGAGPAARPPAQQRLGRPSRGLLRRRHGRGRRASPAARRRSSGRADDLDGGAIGRAHLGVFPRPVGVAT